MFYMAVFRVEKSKEYTVMSNYHLRDMSLTLKAKGLLSQILSLPDDWDYTLAGLSVINRESIDAIRSAVRELEASGYIKRNRERDKNGRLRGAEYTVFERPCEAEKPDMDLPTLENPTQVNPTQAKDNIDIIYIQDKIKTEQNKERTKPAMHTHAREDDNGDLAEVIRHYEERVTPELSRTKALELFAYVRDLGKECCIRAIDIAADNEEVSAKWAYVKGILEDKRKQGVRSLEDWDALERKRGSGRTVTSEKASPEFDRFWEAYPRKEGYGAAKAAFLQIDVPLETLLAAVEEQRKSERWKEMNGKYIPAPAKWLTDCRWMDEPTQPQEPSGPAPTRAEKQYRQVQDENGFWIDVEVSASG